MADNDEGDEGPSGSKRERSPNYPAITFTDALERAEKIYKKEKRSPVSPEVAVKHIGYTALNGASFPVVAALKRYNLMVPSGKKDIRISDDAHYIFVHQPGHPDREAMVRKLAMSPSLFGEVLAAFPDGLPSDENLSAKLQTEWRFASAAAAKSFIRSLRDAVQIRDSGVAAPAAQGQDTGEPIKEAPVNTPQSAAMKPQSQPGTPAPAKAPAAPRVDYGFGYGGVSREWDLGGDRLAWIALPPDPTEDEEQAFDDYYSLLKQELALARKRKARALATQGAANAGKDDAT